MSITLQIVPSDAIPADLLRRFSQLAEEGGVTAETALRHLIEDRVARWEAENRTVPRRR